MIRHTRLEHRFVQFIPEQLESGIIYISMEYATAAHSCCCGCGEQVITPFTPTDWKLTFDGETVSLWPSIGNWKFSCRSHYIIRNSRIVSAEHWDDDQINWGRRRDKQRKERYYNNADPAVAGQNIKEKPVAQGLGLWDQVKRQFRKRQR